MQQRRPSQMMIPWNVCVVPGIPYRPEKAFETRGSHAELVHVHLANEYCACSLQRRYSNCISLRNAILELLEGSGCSHVGVSKQSLMPTGTP
jgi:hypothetical protein